MNMRVNFLKPAFFLVVAVFAVVAPVRPGFADEALFDRTLARVSSEEKAIGQLYKALPAPLYNALKKDADKRLASQPTDKANEEAEWLVVTVADLLQRGKGEKMPANDAVNYAVDNLPEFMSVIAGYKAQYPNLVNFKKLNEEQKKFDAENNKYKDAKKRLEDERKFGKVLRTLTGK